MLVYSLFSTYNAFFSKNGQFSTSAENKILDVALIALKLTEKGYHCNKILIWKFSIVLLFYCLRIFLQKIHHVFN